MIHRIFATLFCSIAPAALVAQTVDLRSSDEFISVVGEIVGYNGVMLQVQTVVGVVGVPASEVICYGDGCAQVIATNDFGLTAAAFQDILLGGAVEGTATDGAIDELAIGFEVPAYVSVYSTLAEAYSEAGPATAVVELTPIGELVIEDRVSGEQASLALSGSDVAADVRIGAVPLHGTAPVAYRAPLDWATTTTPSHQLVALKSFSVVVAPNAGVSQISLNDLARIYAGEVTNWSQIGGADVGVLPLRLPENTENGAEFLRLVMEPAGKELADSVLTMGQEAGVSASIGQFPGSVSVLSSANANEEYVIDVAGACGIAIAPTTFNIISGDYPLVRPLMATYDSSPETSLVADVFDYASSDVGQGLAAAEGFANHTAIRQDDQIKNARLNGLLQATLDDAQRAAAGQMFQTLFDAQRLSLTMTGGQASGPEGAWNRAMLIDLITFMQDPANAGREIMLVGFGQSTAGSAAAVEASAAAAAEIKAVLENEAADVIASGNLTVSSFGFGNVAPAACVDGQIAGSEYTRIEVWIR